MVLTERNEPHPLTELSLKEHRASIDKRAAAIDVGHDLSSL
jgi:hypothetical protein